MSTTPGGQSTSTPRPAATLARSSVPETSSLWMATLSIPRHEVPSSGPASAPEPERFTTTSVANSRQSIYRLPGGKQRFHVGPDHDEQGGRGIRAVELFDGVDRIGSTATPDLRIAGLDSGEFGHRRPDHLQTRRGVGDRAGSHFLPRLVRHDQEYPVERQCGADLHRREKVFDVRRVERTSEDPDAVHARGHAHPPEPSPIRCDRCRWRCPRRRRPSSPA